MTLLEEIKSRGYWRILMRPETYAARRVPELSKLERIVEEAQVRVRGWDYPHTRRGGAIRGQNWVGSEDAFGHHLDLWRIYQSGQFIHYRGMGDDWRDISGLWPAPPGWRPGAGMGWGDAVYQYTEIYEFASRLALTEAAAERLLLRTDVVGIEGRALMNDSRGYFLHDVTSHAPSYTHEETLTRAELVAQGRDRAIAAARALFERFSWDVGENVLRGTLERA